METTTQRLEVSKEFNVTASKLYEAWIKEEHLKAWWHPMNNNLQEVENNVSEGGQVKYVFVNAEGEHSFTISGKYKEVAAGKRLVYTWNWDVPTDSIGSSTYILAISFIDMDNNRSRIEVIQEDFKEEESVQPHKEGWEKALADLENYLSQKA